jgi:hypothetical protein
LTDGHDPSLSRTARAKLGTWAPSAPASAGASQPRGRRGAPWPPAARRSSRWVRRGGHPHLNGWDLPKKIDSHIAKPVDVLNSRVFSHGQGSHGETEDSIDQEWTSLLGWKAVTMSPPWSSVLPTFPHTPGASDVRPRVNVERSGGKRARSSRDPHRRQDKPCGGPRRPAARPGSRRARRGGPPVGDTPKGRRRPSGVRVPTVTPS